MIYTLISYQRDDGGWFVYPAGLGHRIFAQNADKALAFKQVQESLVKAGCPEPNPWEIREVDVARPTDQLDTLSYKLYALAGTCNPNELQDKIRELLTEHFIRACQ